MRSLTVAERMTVAGGFAPPEPLPNPPPFPRPGGGGGSGGGAVGAGAIVLIVAKLAWELYTNWDKISADSQSLYRKITGPDMDFDNFYYEPAGDGNAAAFWGDWEDPTGDGGVGGPQRLTPYC